MADMIPRWLRVMASGAREAWRRDRDQRKLSPTPEHPILLRRQRFLYSTKANFLVASSLLWFGLWAEFWGETLKNAVESMWDGWVGLLAHGEWEQLVARGVSWPTVAFGGALCVVTTLLALRLKAEDHVDDEKTLEVFRAVIRAPNARIHDHYPEYWSAFEDELHGALSGITRDEVAKGIRGCLKVIAEMAANFARAEATRGEYGANIMLFVWRDNSGGPLFPKSLVAALRFHSATDLGALRGMLYLPGDLTVRSLDDAHVRVIPNFALPVPDTGSSSAPPPIPGAPFAVIDGGSVHGDARTIADSEACEYFSKSVRDQIREYFSERGAGRNVGSFASYRIGTGTKPAGVLNLDTNHRHVLGPHEEFYTTFTALVVPMLEGLRFAVERYTEGLDIGALALSDAAAAAAAAAKPSSPPSPPKPPPAAEIPAPEV